MIAIARLTLATIAADSGVLWGMILIPRSIMSRSSIGKQSCVDPERRIAIRHVERQRKPFPHDGFATHALTRLSSTALAR
ncbi:MAG TPA: hypothetical protein VHC94_16470 [Nitrobacter sp.]|nr:hypothetical protein [Nitrobacter sp.]